MASDHFSNIRRHLGCVSRCLAEEVKVANTGSYFFTRVLFVLALVMSAYGAVSLFARPKPSTQVDIQSTPADDLQPMSPSETIELITSSGWRFLNAPGAFSEGYEYYFSKAGTFTWTLISDHYESQKGLWNYKEISGNGGLIFLLGQGGQADVLHYGFVDSSHLRLAGDILTPTGNNSSNEVTAPSGLKPAFRDIANPDNFNAYFQITDTVWRKLRQTDDDFVPDVFSFGRDGTFSASYRNGQCNHTGFWSMKSNQLILEMPVHHCDNRGDQTEFIWRLEYRLREGGLDLGQKYAYAKSQSP